MKQIIVVKVNMSDQKSRKKALKTVVSQSGVESAALRGQEKNQIEVVGNGIDAAELTTLLRKKVGCTDLVMVTPLDENKDAGGGVGHQKKHTGNCIPGAEKHPIICPASYPYPYCQQPNYYKVQHSDPSCHIM